MYVISILLACTLSLLAIIWGKSKKISFLFCLFMWILFGWNFYNGDYEAYENLYYNFLADLSIGQYEVGYRLLIYLGNTIGLSFQEFFIVISFLIISLYYRFFSKFSSSPAIFFLCYFWIFFPLDYVLLRNTLAFAIILQGFYCVFFNTKRKYLKYFLCVTIAFTIHSSSIFFLLMYLAFIPRRLAISLVGFLIVIGFFFFHLFFSAFVEMTGGAHRLEFYYFSSVGVFLVNSFIQVLNTILLAIFVMSKKERNRIDLIIYNINVVLLFLIIPYSAIGIFVRIFRNVAIINVSYMLSILLYERLGRKRMVMFVLFLLYLFSFMRFIVPHWYNTIYSLFRYNLIF